MSKVSLGIIILILVLIAATALIMHQNNPNASSASVAGKEQADVRDALEVQEGRAQTVTEDVASAASASTSTQSEKEESRVAVPADATVANAAELLQLAAEQDQVSVIVTMKTAVPYEPLEQTPDERAATLQEAHEKRDALIEQLESFEAANIWTWSSLPSFAVAVNESAMEHLVTSSAVSEIQVNTAVSVPAE